MSAPTSPAARATPEMHVANSDVPGVCVRCSCGVAYEWEDWNKHAIESLRVALTESLQREAASFERTQTVVRMVTCRWCAKPSEWSRSEHPKMGWIHEKIPNRSALYPCTATLIADLPAAPPGAPTL